MAGQRPYGGSEAVASEARGWERGIRCFGDHKPPDNTQELGEHPMSTSIPYERFRVLASEAHGPVHAQAAFSGTDGCS